MDKKRVVAFDIGNKRIGVAISDPFGEYAMPCDTYVRTGRLSEDVTAVAKIAEEKGAQAIVCGISLKQKKEGEAETEATLKITLFVYDTCEIGYVSKAEGGEEYGEETCGMSVFVPRAGDGLWETAKALRKTPEELTRSNPDLVFPLKGKERILVYNRK